MRDRLNPVGPGQIRTSLVSVPRRGVTRFAVVSLGVSLRVWRNG